MDTIDGGINYCCTLCGPSVLKIYLLFTSVVFGFILLFISLNVVHFASIMVASSMLVCNFLLWNAFFRSGHHIDRSQYQADAQDLEGRNTTSSTRKVAKVVTFLGHITCLVFGLAMLVVRFSTVTDPSYPNAFPNSCLDSRPNCCRELQDITPDPGNVCIDKKGIFVTHAAGGLREVARLVRAHIKSLNYAHVVEEYGDVAGVKIDGTQALVPNAPNPPTNQYTVHSRILSIIFGFPDDLCIRVQSGTQNGAVGIHISFHSKARLGYGDQNVNKIRVEEFKLYLEKEILRISS